MLPHKNQGEAVLGYMDFIAAGGAHPSGNVEIEH